MTVNWWVFGMSIPWIGSIVALLSHPHIKNARRLLGGAVACFIVFSFLANPTGLGVLLPALTVTLYLLTWPEGQTAKGLALLGLISCCLWALDRPLFVSDPLSGFPILFLAFLLVLVLWVMPWNTEKCFQAFVHITLLHKFIYFMLWGVFFILFLLYSSSSLDSNPSIFTNKHYLGIQYNYTIKGVLLVLRLGIAVIPGILLLKSLGTPGFWRNLGNALVLLSITLGINLDWVILLFIPLPLFIIINYHSIFSPPLSRDKTSLSLKASPQHILLWNPWNIAHRGMIQTFLVFTLAPYIPMYFTLTFHHPVTDMMGLIGQIIMALILTLHIYALFQSRFVPYRFLLACSMAVFITVPAVLRFVFTLNPLSIISELVIWTIILCPMIMAYRYREVLNPQTLPAWCTEPQPHDSAMEPLSRFWVILLLMNSIGIMSGYVGYTIDKFAHTDDMNDATEGK